MVPRSVSYLQVAGGEVDIDSFCFCMKGLSLDMNESTMRSRNDSDDTEQFQERSYSSLLVSTIAKTL